MGKIPGRKSTRRTVKIDGLLVASFLMPNETQYDKRTCVIEGCDHKIGPTIQMIKDGWQPCEREYLPAFAAREVGDREFLNVGLVCPCHVRQILEQE